MIRSSILARLPIRCFSKTRQTEVANGFEISWRTMSEAEQAPIIKDYAALESQDWHTLTNEQKRAIYTIAYGPPPEADPYETWKVVGGVAGIIMIGVGMFTLVRSGANPAPATISPEYQRATDEYLKKQNSNPIFGISSKKDKSVEELEIR